MPATAIQLRRRAGELKQQALAKLNDLHAIIERQAGGTLQAGETKLTHEELSKRRQEIEDLNREAKELENLDTLEGLLSRSGDASPLAREVLAGAGGDLGSDRLPFKGLGQYLRMVRGLGGPSDLINLPRPSEEQKAALYALWKGASLFTRGDAVKDVKELFPQGNDREFKQAFEQKALVGDDTGSAGRGDFLVPTEHMAELLKAMGELQQFANRARHVPMTRRTLDFPRLAQSTAADTRPVYGFAAITKIGEGVQKDEREPTFEQLLLTAFKYAAYVEASDELLADSIIGLAPVLIELLTSATAYEFDRDTMRGAGGTTEPQGFIGHASTWQQNRETAGTVTIGDVLGLFERWFGNNGVFLHHPSVLPKLGALAASNVIFWNRDVSSSLPGTLLGIPLVKSHKLPVVGTEGDLCLVDPSYYLVGDLQRITVSSSTHFRFRNDITAWRSIYRAAGTPWPAGLFSMEASGGLMTFRVSPFCVLSAVATS